jgi:[ribosomal protein S5]-alanine N-acetyltransferase
MAIRTGDSMLETARAILTPVTPDDYEDVLDMFHEPGTFDHIAPLAGHTDAWYSAFLDSKRLVQEQGQGYYWVVRGHSGVYLGSANLYTFGDTDLMQLGCQLRRAYWRKGLATELMARVRDFAFADFGLATLHGFFEPGNVASRRLLQRLGFAFFKTLMVKEKPVEVWRQSAPGAGDPS